MIKKHSTMVERLAKSGEDIINELRPVSAHMLHMAVGVSGEAGELLDAIKKYAIYGKELDTENVLEECGDLLFYIQGVLLPLGYTVEDAMQHNIDKLSIRYASGSYSNKQAIERSDKK